MTNEIKPTKNRVLYHDNCMDGFCAAFVMWLHFEHLKELDVTEFIPVQYGRHHPYTAGTHVYIVDFSYPPETIKAIASEAKSVTMLDHHASAAEQWGGYGIYGDVISVNGSTPTYVEIVEDRSGAGLALQHTNGDRRANSWRLCDIVARVQDRDLWNFKLPGTQEVNELLSALPRDFEEWKKVIITETDTEYAARLVKAGHYLEIKEILAQGFASKHKMFNLYGHEVPVVNCPANFASRVCEILYKDHPFSVSYCLSTTEVFISLRSPKVGGANVRMIAADINGGGGHDNAAGVLIPVAALSTFLSGNWAYIHPANKEEHN